MAEQEAEAERTVSRYKSPCVKDCPGRSSTCHSECEKYIAFRNERLAMYERKNSENNIKRIMAESYHRQRKRAGDYRLNKKKSRTLF